MKDRLGDGWMFVALHRLSVQVLQVSCVLIGAFARVKYRLGWGRARPILVVAWLACACDTKTAIDSFPSARPAAPAPDAGRADAGGTGEPVFIDDSEGPVGDALDPTLGGRCLDDEQCDDGLECTFDSCDESVARCRFQPDDSACQDGLYCNGLETCSPGLGCRRGEPITCDDENSCTIDRCVESTRACDRKLRDVDGDGDPDARCVDEAGDCSDQDPAVSSLISEVCSNGQDDDCDGEIDEADCRRPLNDACDDALTVTAPGSYELSLDAASADIGSSCSDPEMPDVFVEFELSEPRDVLVSIAADGAGVSAAWLSGCDETLQELSCTSAVSVAPNLDVARLLLRDAAPGKHPLVIFGPSGSRLEITVEFLEPSAAPANETCQSATRLVPGSAVSVDLYDAVPDHQSACGSGTGAMRDLVYDFVLEQPSDVRVFATPADPITEPVVSLRSEDCALPDDEIACTERAGSELFRRALPAGRYFVSVGAALGSRVELSLFVEPASAAPDGESCGEPLPLPLGQVADIDLGGFGDNIASSCQPSGRDAVLALSLEQNSDLLIKQRVSVGDRAAVSLLPEQCTVEATLACASGTLSPVRAVAHDLPAGDYRVVIESEYGNPVQVLAMARPARAPLLVVGADDCTAPHPVPKEGGYFVGNTSGMGKDFTASCDVANAGPDGAPDQLLLLDVDERSLIVLDAVGSNFRTVINLRRGPDCPGTEVPSSCAAAPDGSGYVEAWVEPGTYYVQVDGFAGEEGQWNLEVFVLPQSGTVEATDN